MKPNFSKIMIIIIVLCIIAGVVYYLFKEQPEVEAQNPEITYETVNIITNLRLGISDFDSIHPYKTQNREVLYLDTLIFEPLLSISQDYHIENCLAEEWSKIGEKSYVIKLKKDVKWSNGTEFKPEDVKFSIETLKQDENSVYYENVKEIKKVEIIDDTTIRIELDKEIPFFEYYLIFPIISSEQYKDVDIQKSDTIPVGTGQYEITKLEKNKIDLKENSEWRMIENQNSNTKTVSVQLYDTMGEVYNAFKLGSIDLLHTTNRDVEEYIGSMGYGKVQYQNREYDYLALNCENTLLKYPEVRKAISLVIDRNKIITTALGNKAQSASFPLEEGNYLLQNLEITKKANVESAKKTLENAGWSYEDGFWQKEINGRTKTINITLAVSKNNEARVKVAEEIKKQLKSFGIEISINKISDNQYKNYLKKHQYEMLLTGVNTSLSPDLNSFFGDDNLANYKNEELQTILKDINSITKEELLKEKYSRIVQIYQDEIPYIGLYRNQNLFAYNTSFRGEITPNNYNIYYHFSEWYKQY